MSKTSKTKTETKTVTLNGIHQTLASAREKADQLKDQIDNLQAQLARGTRDMTREASVADNKPRTTMITASTRLPTIAAQIEGALRIEALSTQDLAKKLGVSAGYISSAFNAVRKHMYNVGSEDQPKWVWIIGDSATSGELHEAIERLMRERPMTFGQLQAATGARGNRVAGAINEMRRTRDVVNLGDVTKARWFIVPKGTKLARLTR